MRDRFRSGNIKTQLHRQGSEPVDGAWPEELRPPYRKQLSKAELRQMQADAMANTANIKIKRIPTGKRS